MRKIINTLAVWSALFLMVAVSYDSGDSYCVIFPQNGRDIFGVAQRTILVFGEDEVSLIPQVRFEGDARDFGILVPVPALPKLSTVGSNIFTEASFMTQPIIRQSSDGCGCDNDIFGSRQTLNFNQPDASSEDGSGVTIIQEEIVGMFQTVILQATSADDLTQWLNDNNYKFDPADAQVLADYITKNWFFVAMKLDSSQVPQFVNQWWAATTSPARVTFPYSGSTLTYPLKISAISTNERAEVLVYTISKDPMRFPGAKVEYANEIDETEAESIAIQYPTIANYAVEGMFVTKLRRTFAKSQMQQDIEITTTDDRREFREVRYVNNSGFGWAGILILALVLFFNRRKKN